jgi:hypothetical protein
MSQRVKIGGFGATQFSQGSTKIEEVFDYFSRHFPEGTMVPRQAASASEAEMLMASTRLFTLRRDAPNATDQQFSEGFDPMGNLEKLKGNELVHLEDNKITCMKRSTDPTSKWVLYYPRSQLMTSQINQ